MLIKSPVFAPISSAEVQRHIPQPVNKTDLAKRIVWHNKEEEQEGQEGEIQLSNPKILQRYIRLKAGQRLPLHTLFHQTPWIPLHLLLHLLLSLPLHYRKP